MRSQDEHEAPPHQAPRTALPAIDPRIVSTISELLALLQAILSMLPAGEHRLAPHMARVHAALAALREPAR